MEAIEILRSEAVGEELRRLVDEMVSIACRMPDEIERLAEVSIVEQSKTINPLNLKQVAATLVYCMTF